MVAAVGLLALAPEGRLGSPGAAEGRVGGPGAAEGRVGALDVTEMWKLLMLRRL